jgi:hypothetical protein
MFLFYTDSPLHLTVLPPLYSGREGGRTPCGRRGEYILKYNNKFFLLLNSQLPIQNTHVLKEIPKKACT